MRTRATIQRMAPIEPATKLTISKPSGNVFGISMLDYTEMNHIRTKLVHTCYFIVSTKIEFLVFVNDYDWHSFYGLCTREYYLRKLYPSKLWTMDKTELYVKASMSLCH